VPLEPGKSGLFFFRPSVIDASAISPNLLPLNAVEIPAVAPSCYPKRKH